MLSEKLVQHFKHSIRIFLCTRGFRGNSGKCKTKNRVLDIELTVLPENRTSLQSPFRKVTSDCMERERESESKQVNYPLLKLG